MQQAASFLEAQGWELAAIEETRGSGDATTFARKAVAQGCDAVFVAGGDGTLAETVDGLVGTKTALAVLPGGGGNVFARQLNLPVPGGLHPRPLVESARLLLAGQVRRVDVGRITPFGATGPARHFLCWGGAGFDAQVNRNVEADPERKRRLGPLATFITSFLTLPRLCGHSGESCASMATASAVAQSCSWRTTSSFTASSCAWPTMPSSMTGYWTFFVFKAQARGGLFCMR